MELEEQDSDQDRHVRLQKVAEEWNDLLGRSQDSHDLQHTSKQPPHMEVVAASMEENACCTTQRIIVDGTTRNHSVLRKERRKRFRNTFWKTIKG